MTNTCTKLKAKDVSRTRLTLLEQQGYRCAICGVECTVEQAVVFAETTCATCLANIELELVDAIGPPVVLEPSTDRHIDFSDKWCVYKTTHPRGFYYYGKGITQAVLKGQYKGSGTSLHASWVWYPKDEWTSSVLETFAAEPLDKNNKDPGENKAYAREAEIVNFDMLCDPFCMNDVPGGKGGRSWGRISARSLEKRKQAVAKSWEDPEVRSKHRAGTIAYWASSAARDKQRDNIRSWWEKRRSELDYQNELIFAEAKKEQQKEAQRSEREKNKDATAKNKSEKLSVSAKNRLSEARRNRYFELHDFFEYCYSFAVRTKDNVVIPKKTLGQFSNKITSLDIDLFKEWLDFHTILRWGSDEHTMMLTASTLKKQERLVELEVSRHKLLNKVYKLPAETRTKMAKTAKTHSLIECVYCKRSFKPAALARFHGDNCKSK